MYLKNEIAHLQSAMQRIVHKYFPMCLCNCKKNIINDNDIVNGEQIPRRKCRALKVFFIQKFFRTIPSHIYIITLCFGVYAMV